MLHTYVARFDVTENLEKILVFWMNSRSCLLLNFFCKIGIVALSFVCDKYCPIMHFSFYFYLYLILYAYV